MRLQLNQDSVIKEVRQTSAYASCSDPDHPENYRFVTATESDRPLLERFFSDSFTEICELLKHSLAEVVRHGSRIFLYLILPRTNRIPRSTILAALTGYLVDRVLSHWFAVVCPDKAEPYRTSANDRLTLLRRLLAPTPPPRTPSPL